MGKDDLKVKISKRQKGRCAVCNHELPRDPLYFDLHRHVPRTKGGGYDENNCMALCLECHQKTHENFRVKRDDEIKLRFALAAYEHALKEMNKTGNRIDAIIREGNKVLIRKGMKVKEESPDGEPEKKTKNRKKKWEKVPDYHPFKEDIVKHIKVFQEAEKICKEATKKVEDVIKEMAKTEPFLQQTVRGLGPMTIANLLAYIDLEEAPHISSLWKYVGFHAPSHERYKKGVKGGGNRALRTALRRWAESIEKDRANPYRRFYVNRKEKTANSSKTVTTRLKGGKLVEKAWRDVSPGHRRDDALRFVIKILLSHWWIAGRTYLKLPISEPYSEDHLGHTHIIPPEELGWIVKKRVKKLDLPE